MRVLVLGWVLGRVQVQVQVLGWSMQQPELLKTVPMMELLPLVRMSKEQQVIVSWAPSITPLLSFAMGMSAFWPSYV